MTWTAFAGKSCRQGTHMAAGRAHKSGTVLRAQQPGGSTEAGSTLESFTASMDSVTLPIWLTLSRSALQAFLSMAICTRLGLVTSRSSPTTCACTNCELKACQAAGPQLMKECKPGARTAHSAGEVGAEALLQQEEAECFPHVGHRQACLQWSPASRLSNHGLLPDCRIAGLSEAQGLPHLADAVHGELGDAVPVVLVKGVLNRHDWVLLAVLLVQVQQLVPAHPRWLLSIRLRALGSRS